MTTWLFVAAPERIIVTGLPVALIRTSLSLPTTMRIDTTPSACSGWFQNSNGTTVIDPPASFETLSDVAVDTAGNAIVGGFLHVPFESPEHLLARVMPTGQLDAAFGTGGIATWSPGLGVGGVRAAALQADGRILAAGSATYGAVATLARFMPSGQPDPSFGDGGFVTSYVSSIGVGIERPGRGRRRAAQTGGWPPSAA